MMKQATKWSLTTILLMSTLSSIPSQSIATRPVGDSIEAREEDSVKRIYRTCREVGAGISSRQEKDAASLACSLKELSKNFIETKGSIKAEGLSAAQSQRLMFEGMRGIDYTISLFSPYEREGLGSSTGPTRLLDPDPENNSRSEHDALEVIKRKISDLANKTKQTSERLSSLSPDFYSSPSEMRSLSHHVMLLKRELASWKEAIRTNLPASYAIHRDAPPQVRERMKELERNMATNIAARLWPEDSRRRGEGVSHDYNRETPSQSPQGEQREDAAPPPSCSNCSEDHETAYSAEVTPESPPTAEDETA